MCLTHMLDTEQMLLESEWLRVFTQGAHCVMPTTDNTGLLTSDFQMSLKLGVSWLTFKTKLHHIHSLQKM